MNRIFYIFLLIVMITFVSSNIPVKAQGAAHPILLVYNTAAEGKYGRYIAEILKAEGINAFDTADLSSVNAGTLNSYDLVILGRGGLNGSQSSLFSGYVNSGGRLIAFHPDIQLNPIVGLSTTGAGSITPQYMKIQNAASYAGQQPGAGLSPETLQLHTGAIQYSLAGSAVMLAELYTYASTPGTFPAVTGNVFGSGLAAAFTYDLPENILLTRQGNPNNAYVDADHDGIIRTIDLYQSAAPGDPQWVDLNRIPVPQADIQQRLFARLVRLMVKMPLPQLWYFPGSAKTMLVLTSDDHGSGTQKIQNMIDHFASFGGKTTFYLSMTEFPNDASVNTWRSQGTGFGIHPLASSSTIHNLAEGYQAFVDWWGFQHASGSYSRTVRNHQVAWVGWTDAVAYESANHIALDTNNYAWGPWLKNGSTWMHGYINGSGLPMKFAQLDGTVLPVYQQATQLVDEQLFGVSIHGFDPNFCNLYPQYECGDQATSITHSLIDASQSGYYSALMTQFHTDYWGGAEVQAWESDTMAYANSKSIPIWNADQWLVFTENRYAANITNLAWNLTNGELTFDANPAVDLTTMLPVVYNGSSLLSINSGVTPVATSTVNVNGVDMAFFTIPAGAHSFIAHYDQADVSIVDTSVASTVHAGASFTYQWTVSNAGPSTAASVQVSDQLPANLTLVSAATSVGTCGAGNPVVCDLGTLLSGATANVTIKVNVDPLARGTLENTASVTAATVDLTPGNNSATKSLNLTEAVDLNVSLSANPNPARANHLLRYTLDVSNLGVSTAQNVISEVHLPAGAVFVGVIGAPDWVCNQASGVVTCTRSQLGTGSAQPVLIDILAPLTGSGFTANAAVAFSGSDLDSANNSINLLTSLTRNYFIPAIQNH